MGCSRLVWPPSGPEPPAAPRRGGAECGKTSSVVEGPWQQTWSKWGLSALCIGWMGSRQVPAAQWGIHLGLPPPDSLELRVMWAPAGKDPRPLAQTCYLAWVFPEGCSPG